MWMHDIQLYTYYAMATRTDFLTRGFQPVSQKSDEEIGACSHGFIQRSSVTSAV